MSQPNSAALPADMRYIDHGTGGGPEVLVPQRAALPVPGADEILVRVAYAGVNRPDVLQRSGNYPPPPGASPWLGLEVSGQVAAVGAAVTQWRVGDAVCALTNGGGYAEFVTVPAAQALPVPRGLSLLQAAALPETYFTVWANVFERGRLAAGETLLIHGGSSGIGTYPHLSAEMFKWRAGGLFVVHIPYRGTGLVITDLVSGQIAFLMDSVVSAQPHIRDGKVRPLAVSGERRSPSLPDVPTFAEAGIGGMDISNWFGAFVPAGTPPEVLARLNREINAALRAPEVLERLERAGAEPAGGSPEQFARLIRADHENWKAVIKRAGIKPE